MNKSILVIVLLSALSFSSCQEEEVDMFQAERGVNFVLSTGNNHYTDNYKQLSTEVKFFDSYVTQGLVLKPRTINIGLQLEGTTSEQPIKVRIKKESVEGYETANVVFPEEVIFDPGQYQTSFPVECQLPAEYDKLYKVRFSIDYPNSDVVAGTKERQFFDLTVSDMADWAAMEATNESDWNRKYSQYIGNYGPVKARFIFFIFGQSPSHYLPFGYPKNTITELIFTNVLYGSGLAESYIVNNYIKKALASYNAEHEKPLSERDGTLVSYDPN